MRGQIADEDAWIFLGLAILDNGSRLIVIDNRLDVVPERQVLSRPGLIESGDYVQQTELELERARETILTTIEDLETSNEEPKSSNDEMMPMNEELPSANEELSSTNEELQVRITEGERMASERRLDEIEQLHFDNSQAIALLSADGTYLRTNLRMAEINVLGVDDHVGRRMVTVVPDLMDEVQVTFNEVLKT